MLAGIPEHIGGEGDQGDVASTFTPGEAAEITALLDGIEFSPEDVAGAVAQFCEALDKWFDSEVWKINSAQQQLIGKPYSKLANSLWAKVKTWLPGWLQAACDATPGLMGSIMVTAIVFGPKAMQQFALSRARQRTPRVIQPNNAPQAAAQPQPTPAAEETRRPLVWPDGAQGKRS